MRDDTTQTVQLSGISNKYMDEGDVRYVNVNTNASSITLTNSNSRVAEVTAGRLPAEDPRQKRRHHHRQGHRLPLRTDFQEHDL